MIREGKNRAVKLWALLAALLCCVALSGCAEAAKSKISAGEILRAGDIPAYDESAFVAVNDNIPDFPEEDKRDVAFERYSPLDRLGRCGTAYANIGRELMPTEKRGSIGNIKPAGWHTVKYDHIEGKYLYNRCHLIGYQLTAENANEDNLITGTRYLNVEGMLPFENMVADYVKETGNHVLYRVTPVYDGSDLIAEGVRMEGYSVEDKGDGICFDVFAYNVQPGVEIDYATGESRLEEGAVESDMLSRKGLIRGNSRSRVYHCPDQASYKDMADSKYLVLFKTEEEARAAGYRKAGR